MKGREAHHMLCLGVMARCYEHVPEDLRAAIKQGVELAQGLGMEVSVPAEWMDPDPEAYASKRCDGCGGTQFDRVNLFKIVPATHPANGLGEPAEIGIQAAACRKCGTLIDARLEDKY